MPILPTLTAAVLDDNVDRSQYTSASATLPASALILAHVNLSRTTSDVEVPSSVTGWSLTWTLVGESAYSTGGANNRRVFLYASTTEGTSPGSGSFVVNTTSQHSGCFIDVFSVVGCRVIGNSYTNSLRDQGSSVYYVVGNTGGATSVSATLAAVLDARNRPMSFVGNNGSAITPRTNWSELHEVTTSSPTCNCENQWRSDAFETTASASWTGTFTASILATEIRIHEPALMMMGMGA